MLGFLEIAVKVVEAAFAMAPKIKEALESKELTPEKRAELEARIQVAYGKLKEWV